MKCYLAEAEDRLPIQEVRVGPAHVSARTGLAAVMGSSDLRARRSPECGFVTSVSALTR
jgi:hypothetical protein